MGPPCAAESGGAAIVPVAEGGFHGPAGAAGVTLRVTVPDNGDTKRHSAAGRRPPVAREPLRRAKLGKRRVCLPEGNSICYTSGEWLRFTVAEKGGLADAGQSDRLADESCRTNGLGQWGKLLVSR